MIFATAFLFWWCATLVKIGWKVTPQHFLFEWKSVSEKFGREVTPPHFHFWSKSTSQTEVMPLYFFFQTDFWFPSHKRRGEGCRSCVIGRRVNSHVSRVLLAFCLRAPAFCSPKKARGPTFLPFYSAEIRFLSEKRSQGGVTSAWDADFDWKWKPGGATSFSLADFHSKRKRCGATSQPNFTSVAHHQKRKVVATGILGIFQ